MQNKLNLTLLTFIGCAIFMGCWSAESVDPNKPKTKGSSSPSTSSSSSPSGDKSPSNEKNGDNKQVSNSPTNQTKSGGFQGNLPSGFQMPSDDVGNKMLREYGAMFVAKNGVTPPSKVVFRDESDVSSFQSGVQKSSENIGGITIELQTPAMNALKEAVAEAKQKGLSQSEAAKPFLLKHLFLSKELETDEKIQTARDFMTENELTFPIVLKPDVGERGFDVKIIKNPAELEEKISESAENFILQEFAGGEETSVFYYRYPTAKKGKIFAITEKRFPRVTGDGEATLEELILRDDRAICLAKSYLERNAERLETVPENGEEVQIIDIGTHSRGAIFLDGGWMKTDILEEKIDEICRGFKGFNFGRFDIRVKSFEDFTRAENFKIVELNGVTSEATSIYDKRNSLFDAYKILFQQWKIAFEIGAENRKLGAKSTSLIDLIKLTFGKQIQNPKSKIQN